MSVRDSLFFLRSASSPHITGKIKYEDDGSRPVSLPGLEQISDISYSSRRRTCKKVGRKESGVSEQLPPFPSTPEKHTVDATPSTSPIKGQGCPGLAATKNGVQHPPRSLEQVGGGGLEISPVGGHSSSHCGWEGGGRAATKTRRAVLAECFQSWVVPIIESRYHHF